MKFEHLVEINNPQDPRIEPLTRLQLWRGLVLRAEEPALFIPHLDSCTIIERSDSVVSRCLDFGNLIVNDHVHYAIESQVRFYVPAQGEILASTLEMTIEEPQPERLFVRFTYEDASPEEGPDAFYNDFRKKAYREADIDTIRIIRQMASQGRFNGPENEDAPDMLPN